MMEGRLSSYTKHVLKSTVLNCSISQQHLQCCPFTGKVVRKSDERWQRSLLGWGQSSRARGRVHWLGLQRPGWRNKRVKWGELSNAVRYQEDGIGGGSGEQYWENGTGGGGSRSGDSVEDGDGSSQNGVSVGSKVGKYAASTAMAVKDSLPPEGVIVLLSCLVGLLTGGSVVLFNLVVRCMGFMMRSGRAFRKVVQPGFEHAPSTRPGCGLWPCQWVVVCWWVFSIWCGKLWRR